MLDAPTLRVMVCDHTWQNGHSMVRDAVNQGPCLPLVRFCLAMRKNKRSRHSMAELKTALRKAKKPRWLSNLEQSVHSMWLLLKRLAAPQDLQVVGEQRFAGVSRGEARPLVHAGFAKEERRSIAERGAEQQAKVWASLRGVCAVLWMDNWYRRHYRATPVASNVSLDVTAVSVLHTSALPHFVGHPNLTKLVDSIPSVLARCRQQWTAHVQVCKDLTIEDLDPEQIRAPLDINRPPDRSRLYWLPFGIYESRTGHNLELLDLLILVKAVQQQTTKQLPLLVDCNIHYRILKLMYSKHTVNYNVTGWLHEIPLIYGVWHPYKHLCNLVFRSFLPFFAYVMDGDLKPGSKVYSNPKLFVIERTVACLFLSVQDIVPRITTRLNALKAIPGPRDAHMEDGIKALEALHTLLTFFIPSLFTLGYMVRTCNWDGRQADTGCLGRTVLYRCFMLISHIVGEGAHKTDYVRTLGVTLLYMTD